MQTSVAVRRGVLGAMLLLAAASLLAATPQTTKNAASDMGAIFSDSMIASMLGPKPTKNTNPAQARSAYARGVQALLAGDAGAAEHAAKQAIAKDKNFSDAYALAATAELSQRKFAEAQRSATRAVQMDATSVKAHVILATADNYLGDYGAASAALEPVQDAASHWWQAAYQRARAEAGMEHAEAALDWSNRAALLAPPEFAPLHLLHASALAAAARYAQAADELAVYLQIAGAQAPQRAMLEEQLTRLKQMAGD